MPRYRIIHHKLVREIFILATDEHEAYHDYLEQLRSMQAEGEPPLHLDKDLIAVNKMWEPSDEKFEESKSGEYGESSPQSEDTSSSNLNSQPFKEDPNG